jgi:hypothetical protein
MRFQFLRLQMARETLFRLEQWYRFWQAPRDVAQLHVLAGMPNSISPTKFRKGLLRPAVRSELKRGSGAFSGERILLGGTGDASRAEQDFWGKKPFSHGFRPLPLLKNDKPLTFLRLSLANVKNSGRS